MWHSSSDRGGEHGRLSRRLVYSWQDMSKCLHIGATLEHTVLELFDMKKRLRLNSTFTKQIEPLINLLLSLQQRQAATAPTQHPSQHLSQRRSMQPAARVNKLARMTQSTTPMED